MATAKRSIRVLIIDDNPQLCAAMERWLLTEQAIGWVACQTDWRAAEEQVRQEKPDVVMLDIDMPGCSGIDLIKPLRQAHPDAKIVMLSSMVSPEYVQESMREGAAGYLVKHDESSTIPKLVQRVAAGETVLSPSAADALKAKPR